MHCTQCGTAAHAGRTICGACAAPLSERHAGNGLHRNEQPTHHVDIALRGALLEFFLELCTSTGLSDWLRDLNVDSRGSVDEKKRRIREHTKFFSSPTKHVSARVVDDLRRGRVGDAVALCEKLDISIDGTKPTLIRRLHRHVETREGLLPILSDGLVPNFRDVHSIVEWYPVYQEKQYEKEHYDEFYEVMADVFGQVHAHEQMAVAHGSTLKIDFHIGSSVPGNDGTGVEFKMPANNSDLQKALGQMGQYQSRYRDSLIVVIFPNLLDAKHVVPFQHELTRMNITHVVKEVWRAD
jgi:hypothetical protein